ncbi:uncharacterized protein ACLA_064930 [Aspergillus clavatus NRRL 1]|uniref:DUF7624 domain-containing protein n=1 Tax=Aspergillus clavatus (strain ATCC 1007 / CBS 513.65 / DSM 816 / NCTC 3887 / NRRL 1 / QM 1276 / 107) TaxID=344612 RepID=A1CFY1_ASPCL|nr:uncharacterized protein ACLA_064930 [Aspergillus clavatus NRRL 1]EAW10861.1 conserved hypothetical protein [Aspergillus clavatus NRRL 1]
MVADMKDTSLRALPYNAAEITEYDNLNNCDEIELTPSASTMLPGPQAQSNTHPELRIRTAPSYVDGLRAQLDEDEPPQSVIHAPPGFAQFMGNGDTSSTMERDTKFVNSGAAPETPLKGQGDRTRKKHATSLISPSPLTTSIAPAQDWSERATPRAQTRQDFEGIDVQSHFNDVNGEFHRSRQSVIEDVPYQESVNGGSSIILEPGHYEALSPTLNDTSHTLDFAARHLSDGEAEMKALKTALAECWTLCNTLAKLSYIHRGRLADTSDSACIQENAWTSCWRLCQGLYESQKDEHASQVNPMLDLCRDFCQTLFEARVRDNELADSVLRVSFELNNHLFNTHDRNLPEAFRERTLDFYITLCHRLMKQRTRMSETDSLLKACWSLAEMLFTIRQSKKEGRRMDEEIFSSAVQACWELCDLFREGWTQRSLRCSDRGTPRPSQAAFPRVIHQAQPPGIGPADEVTGHQGNPETPTTIFDETATLSPEEAPPQNIFVLGQSVDRNVHKRWPSNSSTLSGQSQSSEQTSSTYTIKSPSSNDLTLKCIKALVVKAALDTGFQPGGAHSLLAFVKSLPSDAFGSAPWQMSLLKSYRRLLTLDPAFRNAGAQPYRSAGDIANAVHITVQGGRHPWLQDLYRLVFGFHVEEASSRESNTPQT